MEFLSLRDYFSNFSFIGFTLFMDKPSRNEPCHCGSGKNYKKCCIGTDEAMELRSDSDFMLNFSSKDKKHKSLLNYNKIELLKILAYLQLLPQNHGKNIR